MNKIAIVFDFDDTLAPDSTSSYLESIGMNVHDFWKKKVQPLLEDFWKMTGIRSQLIYT
jgi:hypothetical protein